MDVKRPYTAPQWASQVTVPHLVRRWATYIVGAAFVLLIIRHIAHASEWEPVGRAFPGGASSGRRPNRQAPTKTIDIDKPFHWKDVGLQYPHHRLYLLPTTAARRVPQIQYDFKKRKTIEEPMHKTERSRRMALIKDTFMHSWNSYKKHAWGHDALMPVTGDAKDNSCAWATTMIESLDTLAVMNADWLFLEAMGKVEQVDFSRCAQQDVAILESSVRHLGGLLGAYDITNGKHPSLLTKAIEVGDLIYKAFDTPNGMLVPSWNWRKAAQGEAQVAPKEMTVAELGSVSLELTRLSQITRDPKYYDVVARIAYSMGRNQKKTRLPGMWPLHFNAKDEDYSKDTTFTLGGSSNAAYEYLSKQYILLNGRKADYGTMHLNAIARVKDFLAFEPLLPHTSKDDLPREPLLLGTAHISGTTSAMVVTLDPRGEQLACYAGGMVALGARALSSERAQAATNEDLIFAQQLTQGCIWSYHATATGIGPEVFHSIPCRKGRAAVTSGREADWKNSKGNCTWNEAKWLRGVLQKDEPEDGEEEDDATVKAWKQDATARHIATGFTEISDPSYSLRPEVFESLFVLYRLTGDEELRTQAWKLFESVTALTRTEKGYASLPDVTKPIAKTAKVRHNDVMESFWMGGTLKYLYLIFAEPTVCNLDEFVFNTEAHPFRYRDI